MLGSIAHVALGLVSLMGYLDHSKFEHGDWDKLFEAGR